MVADDGTLTFGDRHRSFDDEPPLSLQLALRTSAAESGTR